MLADPENRQRVKAPHGSRSQEYTKVFNKRLYFIRKTKFHVVGEHVRYCAGVKRAAAALACVCKQPDMSIGPADRHQGGRRP